MQSRYGIHEALESEVVLSVATNDRTGTFGVLSKHGDVEDLEQLN